MSAKSFKKWQAKHPIKWKRYYANWIKTNPEKVHIYNIRRHKKYRFKKNLNALAVYVRKQVLFIVQEFAEKIRLEKKDATDFSKNPSVRDDDFSDGYNQAVRDLEALKAELLKGASSK